MTWRQESASVKAWWRLPGARRTGESLVCVTGLAYGDACSGAQSMTRFSWRPAIAVAATLAAGLLLPPSSPALAAAAKLVVLGHYTSQGRVMNVTTFAEKGKKEVLLIMNDGKVGNSLTLYADQWDVVTGLVGKAEAAQSDTWKEVGEYDETGSDPSNLTVSGGKGVRLAILSSDGTSTYDVAPEDLAKFDQSLQAATAYVHGG